MPYISVGRESSGSIDLHYEDHGTGKPVVLIHGWPLSGASWEKQVAALLSAGYRVVTYDRRGFGQSSRPSIGYDYDTLAADLHKLMMKLDLREAALVGFSMGAGEVARYLGTFGSERVREAVLVAGVPPFLLRTPDNPNGVDGRVFDDIRAKLARDRFAYFTEFFEAFYDFDVLGGDRVSREVLQASWNVASSASAKAVADCVPAWLTDFRKDLARIDVPTLIVHGDSDRILPVEVTGAAAAKAVTGSRLVVIRGAPHGLLWTHAQEINGELLSFLQAGWRASDSSSPAARSRPAVALSE